MDIFTAEALNSEKTGSISGGNLIGMTEKARTIEAILVIFTGQILVETSVILTIPIKAGLIAFITPILMEQTVVQCFRLG